MDPITRQAIAVSAGAGGADNLYVDDVFSTFVYEGNSSARTIANGIDLSGEGGLVWIKNRFTSWTHYLFDTERSPTNSSNMYYLKTNSSSAQGGTNTDSTKDFGGWASNGFLLGQPFSFSAAAFNGTGNDYVSWTFRKAPGFFDIVTWTGNGSNRTIAHNLGSVPGFIMVKRYSAGEDWTCYHRSLGATKYIQLNGNEAAAVFSQIFNNTNPTSTHFSIGTHDRVNTNGENYIAYVFAHDDQSFGADGDEAIIKCGSYTGNGSTPGVTLDLGFEPQFLLIKNTSYTDATSNWMMFDNMRGLAAQAISGTQALTANLSTAEGGTYVGSGNTWVHPTSTGFMPGSSANAVNRNGDTMIYIAIRRPHKPPTAGTEVFAVNTRNGNQTANTLSTAGFPVDLAIISARNVAHWSCVFDRLRGIGNILNPQVTRAEVFNNTSVSAFDSNTAIELGTDAGNQGTNRNSQTYVDHLFKRAAGFMDVVAYTGTGSAMTINHNLGATPELLIVKRRSSTGTWWTYSSVMGNNAFMRLEGTFGSDSPANLWNNTTPSSTTFSLGNNSNVVSSGVHHIAFLFASLSGISKVGSYSGNSGYDVNVDCGFTAGARFILIKRTDSTGDWYYWDTARGIVSGNDPYLRFNSTDAETTNTDYIDPLNAGFTVTSSAPAALNASGGTYLFLAIA